MKKDHQNPQGALQGQPGSADKTELRKKPSDIHKGAGPEGPSSRGKDKQEEHAYPKNEQRWPENKVPTK